MRSSFKKSKIFMILRSQMPFSRNDEMTIEKSPNYFANKNAPWRIFKWKPEIKLILIIRDPVVRAVSEYTHCLGKTNTSFNPALYDNVSRAFERKVLDSKGEIRKNSSFIRNGFYVEHLKLWLKYFPIEQILILNGVEFTVSPYKQLQKVEKFLNLKPVIVEDDFIFNPKKGFLCIKKKLNSSKGFSCLGKSKGRKHPFIRNEILIKMQELYKPYNIELFEMIKTKPFWLF